jgi:hypothetical protein
LPGGRNFAVARKRRQAILVAEILQDRGHVCRQDESDPRYARVVPVEEIADAKNDFNLNLPRYIDSSEPEDIQDIDGHLRGGIPKRDLDALGDYWRIMPALRAALFEPLRPGYFQLKTPIAEVKPAILGHPEFVAFNESAIKVFEGWKDANTPRLKTFAKDGHPKALIQSVKEALRSIGKEADNIEERHRPKLGGTHAAWRNGRRAHRSAVV